MSERYRAPAAHWQPGNIFPDEATMHSFINAQTRKSENDRLYTPEGWRYGDPAMTVREWKQRGYDFEQGNPVFEGNVYTYHLPPNLGESHFAPYIYSETTPTLSLEAMQRQLADMQNTITHLTQLVRTLAR